MIQEDDWSRLSACLTFAQFIQFMQQKIKASVVKV